MNLSIGEWWGSRFGSKTTRLSETEQSEPVVVDTLPEPFVSIPCECGKNINIMSRIFPGQAAVTNCPNCNLSWTVYNPSLIVRKTKEVPEEAQEIWRELSA